MTAIATLRRIWRRTFPSVQFAAVLVVAVTVLKTIDSVRLGRVDVTIRGVVVCLAFIATFAVVVPLVLKPVLNLIARTTYKNKHK